MATFLSVSPKMLLAVMVIASLEITGAFAATFTIKNNCAYTVWPGTLTSGQNQAQLSTTGFELGTGATQTVDSPAPWTGRFWARTGCTTQSGSLKCDTADCASGQAACNGAGATPPATLAEFTLASNGRQDFYDISLVDGFNLPLSITPQGGSNCQSASCSGNVNSVCPSELSVIVGGNTVACKSACLAFGTAEYCCTGDHSTSETCPATDYSKIFKNVCPQAYSYAYDDASSTFTCTGGANYLITFCP